MAYWVNCTECFPSWAAPGVKFMIGPMIRMEYLGKYTIFMYFKHARIHITQGSFKYIFDQIMPWPVTDNV